MRSLHACSLGPEEAEGSVWTGTCGIYMRGPVTDTLAVAVVSVAVEALTIITVQVIVGVTNLQLDEGVCCTDWADRRVFIAPPSRSSSQCRRHSSYSSSELP